LLELRSELDFPLKSFGANSRGQVRREDFDYDLAIESILGRKKNSRHAAAAELSLDCVC